VWRKLDIYRIDDNLAGAYDAGGHCKHKKMNPASSFHTSISISGIGSSALAGEVSSSHIIANASVAGVAGGLNKATISRYKRFINRTKRVMRHMTLFFVLIFAIIGMGFSGIFVAMQYHLLDVKGSSISRDSFFKTVPKTPVLAAKVSRTPTAISCVQRLTDGTQAPVCAWNKSPEYATIRAGLNKDKDVINTVAEQTGVPARIIAATVVPEQLRWFTSDRESFKKMFEPLKVLGVAAQFTMGIGGIHPNTAKRIEQYASDTNSPFYAGKGMSALLAYPSKENPHDNSIFTRLADSKDHYYSYLYVALFIKEISNQWARAGYDISNRPDVIVTLYNIGYDHSQPKADPQIGGATITVGGTRYAYGELGTDFYNSDELTAIFPMQY
jgi:hypothetical protein